MAAVARVAREIAGIAGRGASFSTLSRGRIGTAVRYKSSLVVPGSAAAASFLPNRRAAAAAASSFSRHYSSSGSAGRFHPIACMGMGADGLPLSVDWTKAGAVTPVINQWPCGGCWAHTAAGAIESLHFIETGNLVELSAQQLLDCNTAGCDGCQGGYVNRAFQYTMRNGGLVPAALYPFIARTGPCLPISSAAVTIDSYEYVIAPTERQLKALVARQPVAVSIAADSQFKRYQGGILSGHNYNVRQLDHDLLCVGYGAHGREKFWLCKNWFGLHFGELGYVKIARGIYWDGDSYGIRRGCCYPLRSSINPACTVKSDSAMKVRSPRGKWKP